MAEIASEPIEFPAQPTAKRRGRPPNNPDPESTETKEEPYRSHHKTPTTKLPPISKNVSLDQALEYWAEQDKAYPNRLLAYLYRLYPIIIRPPQKHHIKCLDRPVNRDQLLAVWGVGKYRIEINDQDAGQVTKARWEFEGDWEKHPPTIGPGELAINRPENEDFINWARARGLYGLNATPAAPNSETATVAALVGMIERMLAAMQKGQPVDTTGAKVAEMFSQASSKAIDIAFAQVKQNNPEDTLKLITALQAAFKPKEDFGIKEVLTLVDRLKPTEQPKDPRVDMLVEELKASRLEAAEARKRSDSLMDKLFEERTNRPQDAFTQTLQEKLMTRAIDLLDGGGSRAAGKFAWLAEYLPGILDTVKPVTQGLGMLIQRAANRNGTAPTQPAGQGALPPAGPQPIPDYVQQGANADPSHLSPEQIQMALSNFFQTVGPPLRKHLTEGKTGQEFADFLMANGYLDVQGFTQLKEIGRDSLMGILRQMPAAWANIQPIEKRFTEFLDEFLSWDPNWGTTPPEAEEELPAYLRRKQ